MKNFKIGNRIVGENHEPLIISEIGINHKEYSHTTQLNEDTIKSLSADFN